MPTKLTDGKKVRLTVRHGGVERVMSGTLRRFSQDGSPRWEISDVTESRADHKDAAGRPAYEGSLVTQRYEAVGIDPENVVNVEPLS